MHPTNMAIVCWSAAMAAFPGGMVALAGRGDEPRFGSSFGIRAWVAYSNSLTNYNFVVGTVATLARETRRAVLAFQQND